MVHMINYKHQATQELTNYYLLAYEQALVIRTQDYSVVCLRVCKTVHWCKVSWYNTLEKTLVMMNGVYWHIRSIFGLELLV